MARSMHFVVELDGNVQFEGVAHVRRVIDSLEGVIPDVGVGNKEESGEAVGEEHLATLKVRRKETGRHGARFESVSVLLAPFDAGLG